MSQVKYTCSVYFLEEDGTQTRVSMVCVADTRSNYYLCYEWEHFFVFNKYGFLNRRKMEVENWEMRFLRSHQIEISNEYWRKIRRNFFIYLLRLRLCLPEKTETTPTHMK